MEIEERISAIEAELKQTKNELQEILADIRALLAAAPGPTPPDSGRENPDNEEE